MEQSKLGKRINEVRKSRGLTADKLSELCNINATYLRQIEGGAKMPSLPVFIDICKALHISPDYLLQDELSENEISKIHEIEMLWERCATVKTRACTCNDKGSSKASRAVKQPAGFKPAGCTFLSNIIRRPNPVLQTSNPAPCQAAKRPISAAQRGL